MGRYVVVLPLEPLALGDGYPLKTWPLHLTVAPTFVIDNPLQTAVSAIAPVFAFQRPLMLRAGHDEGFGRSETIPVTVVQQTIELELLHERLVRELTAVAAEFDDPHFTGAGYRAHVTMNAQNAFTTVTRCTSDRPRSSTWCPTATNGCATSSGSNISDCQDEPQVPDIVGADIGDPA